MKIKRIHIDNFGALQDKDITFRENVNLLFNENGWGKTTLSIFIKAMFYGMAPARENIKMERKKYMPWQGGKFGGWLEFSCQKGDFRIVRSFAKTPEGDEVQLIDLNTNKLCPLPKEELGQWLFGVGKETFEMTAFFPQLNFLATSNEQISAGVLGLDKFKYDLASVGDALAKIKKEISSLKKDIVKQSDIDRLIRQHSDLSQDIVQAKKEIVEIDRQIEIERIGHEKLKEQLDKEINNLQSYEKIFAAKLKLERQIKEANEKLANLLLELNKLQEKLPAKKKSFPWGVVFGTVVVVAGLALGFSKILSWAIAGGICGVGLLLGGIFGLLHKKKNAISLQEVTTNNKKEALTEEIDSCQAELEKLKQIYSNYSDITPPNSENKNMQQDLVFNAKLNIERLFAQRKSILYQQERLSQELEVLQTEIEDKSERNRIGEDKINILQSTYDFIVQAKENVSERYVGPINSGMKELLDKFDMRGREFAIDTNFDIKQVTDSGLKEFDYSSQGYKDILSICMRFLLIGQVFKDEKPCVILDDSFVNLDDNNFKNAKKLVEHFSKEMQILYICCSENRRI